MDSFSSACIYLAGPATLSLKEDLFLYSGKRSVRHQTNPAITKTIPPWMQIYTENTSVTRGAWQNLLKPFLNAVILSTTTCKPFYTEQVSSGAFYTKYVYQYVTKSTICFLTWSMDLITNTLYFGLDSECQQLKQRSDPSFKANFHKLPIHILTSEHMCAIWTPTIQINPSVWDYLDRVAP